ncbi:MAG: septum formation initiator family protein [Acidobacteria bacterium]|nr:septum formation initiator family protein [Acidobacteriota bacterium]
MADPPASVMRRRVLRGLLGLTLCVVLVDGVFGPRGLVGNVRLRGRNAALAASLTGLRTGNETLREGVRRLNEDPATIEELAREELGLLKDGELILILKDVPATAPDAAQVRPGAAR